MGNTNHGVEEDIELSVEDFKNPVAFQVSYLNQIPHKKQEEVLLSFKKHRVVVCGRRSGKTQMISGEIIRGAVLNLYPAQLVVAPTYKQVMIVFDKIVELMNKAGVFDDILKVAQSPHPKIIFKNNTFVDFGSADNPDSLRGFAYDRVFKDESAFIKRGADNAIKPLTYDKGAPIWETTTPWGKGDVWERWLRGTRGEEDIGCFSYNYKDNPYLSPDGVKEIEKDIKEYGEDSIYVQCEILGQFVEDRDNYFSRELIERCVVEYELGSYNPHSLFVLGNDFARFGEDSNVSIVVEQDRQGMRVNWIEENNKLKLTETIGKIKIMNDKYNFTKIYLDETGLGAGPTDMLMEDLGSDKVEGMTFTIKSKQDMYSNLNKLFEQGKLKIPNHKKLIYQLVDLKREIMSSGDMKIHHSDKGHDDYPDALALACWYFKGEEVEEYTPFIH